MTSAEQIVAGHISWSLLLGIFLKLALVLALVYFSLALLRQYGQRLRGANFNTLKSNSYLSIIERLPLGEGAQLILVQDPQGMLLLSMKEGQTVLLHRYPPSVAESIQTEQMSAWMATQNTDLVQDTEV